MKAISRRQATVLGGVALAGALGYAAWPRSEPAVPAPAEGTSSSLSRARAAASSRGGAEIPSLDGLNAERGDLAGAVHRNVFRFYDTPTPVPPTPRPTATPIPVQGTGGFIGPLQPTPTPTATPIVPPPVPYKAVGLFGPRDRMIAALEEGGRLIGAREGDVLDGRFILKKINRESVDFAFVGLPPEITRRIPIAGAGSGR